MNDDEKRGKRAAVTESTATSGHESHGSRAADIQAGLMRYLAAEAYREKVEEKREQEKEAPDAPR